MTTEQCDVMGRARSLRLGDRCCQNTLPELERVSLVWNFRNGEIFLHSLLSSLQFLLSLFQNTFSFYCETSLQEADALASWAWASADWFERTLSSSIVDQYYFSLRPSLDMKYQAATAPIPTTRIAISMITPFQNQDDMLKIRSTWWPANNARAPVSTRADIKKRLSAWYLMRVQSKSSYIPKNFRKKCRFNSDKDQWDW